MYSHSISRLLTGSSLLLILSGFLTGCSDDNPAVNSSSDGFVCFKPRIGNGWNEVAASRGEGKSRKLQTLTLRSGDNPLYLVPKEINGINQGLNKQTETRSELTDANGIENFGVFASMKPDGATSLDGLVANYMSNVKVTRENNWQPEERYLWPGSGSLHFNAYSPFIS
ncbi:MAG: fimbrillin family protein, partial [Muribaculaceae bacterium]|nr:fimbrillin family protein [Muribaculaceae bacterium]